MSLIPLIAGAFAVQALAFGLRVWAMFIKGLKWRYEEISITIAFAVLLAFIPLMSLMQYWGFYRNVYSYDITNIDKTTITYFTFKAIYALSMGSTKMSIVFLYFQILNGPRFRMLLWTTQVFNLLLTASFLIALPLTCRPIQEYWALSFETGGHCPDIWDWGGYFTYLNLALDVWIMAVPAYTVARLQMDTRTKIGVIALCALGVCTMAMSILRLKELRSSAAGILVDDQLLGLLWSTIECTTAFIIACMPAIRLVIMTKIPGIFDRVPFASSSRGPKSYGPAGGPRTRASKFIQRNPSTHAPNGVPMLSFNADRSIHIDTEIRMVVKEDEPESEAPNLSTKAYHL